MQVVLRVVTAKSEFNAEEWELVVEGPPVAGLLVVQAERGGMFRESLSMGRVYAEAQKDQSETELMKEVVSTSPTLDKGRFETPEELHAKGPDLLREIAGLVGTKATPEETDEYKRFVLAVATAAAGAKKEGGFLGIGAGEAISDAENAVLDQIASALGIERETPTTTTE
jgi:hypothetical protein